MKNISLTQTLRDNSLFISIVTALSVVIILGISLVKPFQYEAKATLLVIQNQAGIDAYTATKSAEKIGKNLTQIVASTAFYDDVTSMDPSLKGLFSNDVTKRRKEWKRDVSLAIVPETGILELATYQEDKQAVSQLLDTVSFVLMNQSEKYHGGGTAVTIKMIDAVAVSKYPVRPNLVVNIIFAATLGLVLSSMYVLMKQAHELSNLTQVENETSHGHGLNLKTYN